MIDIACSDEDRDMGAWTQGADGHELLSAWERQDVDVVPVWGGARAVAKSFAGVVPAQASPLGEAIERSRSRILNAPLDADDVPYSEDTWIRAMTFLRRDLVAALRSASVVTDIPRILPGPEGSIDLHWVRPGYRLLVNIPPAIDLATFQYRRDNLAIRGEFDPERDSILPLIAT